MAGCRADVVAAGAHFDRRPAVAVNVVNGAESRRRIEPVGHIFKCGEALASHELRLYLAHFGLPAAEFFHAQSEVDRQPPAGRPFVLHEQRGVLNIRGSGHRRVVGIHGVRNAVAEHRAHARGREVLGKVPAVVPLNTRPSDRAGL